MYYDTTGWKLTMKNNLTKKIFTIITVTFVSALLFAQEVRPDALRLYRDGKYAEAAEVCRAEIAENPNNLDSYVVLCWSLVSNRQYSEAERMSSEGRKISRYDPRLVEIQAEAEYFLGKNNAALEHFQEYISIVPAGGSRLGEVYYFMGEIFIRQGKYNKADIAFSQALKIEPLRDRWWSRLGYAREQAKNYTSAAEAYQQALTLNQYQSDAKNGRNRVMQYLQ